MPYNQRAVIEKIHAYLVKKESERKKQGNEKEVLDDKSIIKHLEVAKGYCHGLALLWLYKMSEKNEKWFYDTIKTIVDLPLKEMGKLESHVEKFINHIEWLQHPEKYIPTVRQMDCDETVEVNKEIPLSSVFQPVQLDAVLDLVIQPNKMVCLSGPDHSIGVMRRGAKYHVYNPNYHSGCAKVMDTVKQLRLELIQCLFADFNYPASKLALIINVLGEDDMTETRTKIYKWVIDTTGAVTLSEQGIGPLYLACENHNNELVSILLKKGANPNHPTKDGRYPLVLACYSGYAALVDVLLEYKANPNIEGKQGLPLYLACKHGHDEVIQKLLAAGVQVNHQDRDGETAIFAAVEFGSRKHTVMLLEHKANPLLSRHDGCTAMDIAIMKRDWETVVMMMKFVASPHARNIPAFKENYNAIITAVKHLSEAKQIEARDGERMIQTIDDIVKKGTISQKMAKTSEHSRIGLPEFKSGVCRDGFFSGCDEALDSSIIAAGGKDDDVNEMGTISGLS